MKVPRHGAVLLVLGLALGLCLACRRPSAAERPTVVFAAASLAAPFQAMAEEFERLHPEERLELHFAGTPQLVFQLREGAPADVFASADEANMQKIVDAGQAAGTPSVFALNRLGIVTPKGNPKGVQGLSELARVDLKVALCGPDVPAGRYAREALERAAVSVRSVSDEPSVKAVVSKVQLGELDAGIVYVTDAASAGGRVDLVRILDEHNVVARYPVALLSTGRNRAGAQTFVDYVRSTRGQSILLAFGFSSP